MAMLTIIKIGSIKNKHTNQKEVSEMLWIILGLLLLGGLSGLGVHLRRKAKRRAWVAADKADKRAQIEALITKTGESDGKAYRELTDLRTSGDWYDLTQTFEDGADLRKRANEVVAQFSLDRQYQEAIGPLTELYRACNNTKATLEKQIDALLAYNHAFQQCQGNYLRIAAQLAGGDEICRKLDALLNDLLARLVTIARRGSQAAFKQAVQLVYDSRDTSSTSSRFYQANVKELAWPEGWNKLVDQFVTSPGLDLFDLETLKSYYNVPLTPRNLAQLAVQAANYDDTLLAKVVLAFGTEGSNPAGVRSAVGENLWSSLLHLVGGHKQSGKSA